VSPANLKATLKTPSIDSRSTSAELGCAGFRAAEAYVRPSPIATYGEVLSYGFDLKNATFTFTLSAKESTPEETPTEIYLPEFHFPQTHSEIEVSGGKWAIETEDVDDGTIQKLKWWHGAGEQKITAKGVKHKQGTIVVSEEEMGYLEQCTKNGCRVM
jgi:hypothetical protein